LKLLNYDWRRLSNRSEEPNFEPPFARTCQWDRILAWQAPRSPIRMLSNTVTVSSNDLRRSETSSKGERVKNIQQIRMGVIFERV